MTDFIRVEFTNPNVQLSNERRSKLIKPESDLYKFLEEKRRELTEKHGDLVGIKRMDFHIELIKDGEEPTEELLVNRAKQLEGKIYEYKYVLLKDKA